MGEAKRRAEAIARGEPDPGVRGVRSPGRRELSRRLGLRRDIVDETGAVVQTEYAADAARRVFLEARADLGKIFRALIRSRMGART